MNTEHCVATFQARQYQPELDRIIADLTSLIGNKSLDPLVKQAIEYAYTLGKSEGYVAGVQAITGDQR
jgi:hypothetical protein